ncbi:hypothetical protein EIP86_006739 [Pleurotus ostreatoroseus]|nr:hypothetical protein EIP86_006739 [Pleurotus ostreatoroseus]
MKIYASSFPPLSIPHESVVTYLTRTRFDEFPRHRPAFTDAETGKTITRGEFRDMLLSMGWGLRHELAKRGGVQLQRGDVVMILSPNSLAWPVMLFGGFAAGLRMTLANSAYTPREVLHQWTDSKAKAVLVHPSLLPVLLETFKLLDLSFTDAKRKIIVADWGLPPQSSFNDYITMSDILGKGSLAEEEKYTGEQANETALLCYSSGTTGKPKGVETTHRNLVSVIAMVGVGFPNLHEPNPTMLGVLPFYHIYGCVKILQFPFSRGMRTVIMSRFNPVEFCRAIERYAVTQALIVPPMCLVLAHSPAVDKFNLKSLRIMFSGAAPLGGPLVTALRNRLLQVGADVFISQGYGLTETSPTTHLLGTEDCLRKVGWVGPLLPNLEARLVIEDVEDAKEGEPGELWVRGPSIMKGYWNNKEATKNSITPDGWFKTGDIAIRDAEGHYAIVDRRKELIKYKGFQEMNISKRDLVVPPAELESVLLQHPDIVDAAVIGIVSEQQATELPRAYVVHARGIKPEEHKAFGQEVQEWIKSRVARHKFLRGGVVVVDSVPKSAAGKILRRELRERAKVEVEAESKLKAKL